MTILASEHQVIDRDSVSPDSIAAAVGVMADRLLDKARDAGRAIDWSTTTFRITPSTTGTHDARLLLEAEVLT
jgi:hypothetical protein